MQRRAAFKIAALLRATPGATSRSIASLENIFAAPQLNKSTAPRLLIASSRSYQSREAGTWPAWFSSAASGPQENGNSSTPEGTTTPPGESVQEDAAADASEEEPLPLTHEEAEELKSQLTLAVQGQKEAKDKMLLCLADMENLRARSAQQVETNRKFAVQGIVKQILEVADNLERAAGAVPEVALSSEDSAELRKQLGMLLEGVQMTQKVLNHALKINGVESYRPVGEEFDPNLHSALFQLPDPTKTPGTISIVTKTGYKMHNRVLRAAEVGVVAGTPQ